MLVTLEEKCRWECTTHYCRLEGDMDWLSWKTAASKAPSMDSRAKTMWPRQSLLCWEQGAVRAKHASTSTWISLLFPGFIRPVRGSEVFLFYSQWQGSVKICLSWWISYISDNKIYFGQLIEMTLYCIRWIKEVLKW